jgi:hypothetical protein
MNSKRYLFLVLGILLSVSFISTPAVADTLCTKTEIRTEIEINSTAEKVWKKLIDFKNYPNWHTYLSEVKGEPVVKTKIKCTTLNADSSTTHFSAYIQEVIPNKKLSWGGSLGFIFKAKHYFIIEKISENKIHLTQGEYWKGLFGENYGKKIYQETYQKFVRMNEHLKFILESE